MMNQPNLGQLVRDVRRAAGLTQEELAARAGLSTRAISDLERGVNHTPRPSTVQLLVAALDLSGREREHFETVARMHEVTAASAPPPAWEPPGPSTATGVAASIPLIGRDRERMVLEEHLEGEGPPLLLVAGEPGVGKTRLLQEAAALGASLRLHVLHGTVLSQGDADALDPIADALRQAFQVRSPVLLRRDLQGCASLVDLLPELASLDHAGAQSAPRAANPAVMTDAVLRFMANTAGPAGTLLTLDNLHAAAAPGLALLARLIRSTSDLPLRIVAAYRDGHATGRGALSALLAGLSHDRLVRRIALSRLSTREAADLLTVVAMQHGQAIDPWPTRALRDSGGVPFYIVAWGEHLELLRRERAEAAVPWPIQQSVRFRLDAGPASARPVLEVLAATGGRATLALLEDLVALPPHHTATALEWSLQERLVVMEDEQTYAFAYGAVRTAVESDLSPTRRQVIRRRMASMALRHRQRRVARERGAAALDLSDGYTPKSSAPGSTRYDERAYHIAVLRRGRTPDADEPPLRDD